MLRPSQNDQAFRPSLTQFRQKHTRRQTTQTGHPQFSLLGVAIMPRRPHNLLYDDEGNIEHGGWDSYKNIILKAYHKNPLNHFVGVP